MDGSILPHPPEVERFERSGPATREIRVVASVEELSHLAAETMVLRAVDAIRERGRFIVALSGGSTPTSLFELLASPPFVSRIDWSHVHVCWGDERCVSPADARSNYRTACDVLLDHVPIPDAHVHRMRGEAVPEVAAAAYEVELRTLFDAPEPQGTDFPSFDLILLGVGDDGHTASLFPKGAALYEQSRWAVAEYVESVAMWRITLTLPLINASRDVLFLVAGTDKADVVRQLFAAPTLAESLPAARVAPSRGHLQWILDRAAAAKTPDAHATGV